MLLSKIDKTSIITGVSVLLLFIIGYLFPETWWGSHFLSFLELHELIILSFLFVIVFGSQFFTFSVPLLKSLKISTMYMILIAIIYAILILSFPVIVDYYGDAYKYLNDRDVVLENIPKGTHDAFWNYNLHPSSGERTVLAIATYFTYFFKTTYAQGFNIMNAIFGGLYAFVWLVFVNKALSYLSSKIVLIICGLFAPFMLFYFGHMEIYAPVYFMILLWLTGAWIFIQQPSTKKAVVLFILLLFCFKVHSMSLLLSPIYLFILLNAFSTINKPWKWMGLFVFVPVIIAGMVLYFFIFKDHIDDRSFKQGTVYEYDHLFLPLFSPEPPLDNYNILSFNHFFDFFNLIISWSPALLVLFILIVLTARKLINWSKPSIVFTGSSLILFVALSFVINPLLSMPRDWDLMSIAAVIFSFFVVLLFRECETLLLSRRVFTNMLSVLILSLSVFVMHQNRNAIGDRMETLSIGNQTTYYEWTSELLKFAKDARNRNPNYVKVNEKVVNRLRENALVGIDYEFAEVLHMQGNEYLKIKAYTKAIDYYEEALVYYPIHYRSKLKILEPLFKTKQYKKAYEISKELLQINFPSPQRAHKIAVHCALEAGAYKEALNLAKNFTLNWDEEFMNNVYFRLLKGDDINDVKKMFSGS